MANRQSLFDRRLKIWIITEKLMQLYRINSKLPKKGEEPQFAISLCFERLPIRLFFRRFLPLFRMYLKASIS